MGISCSKKDKIKERLIEEEIKDDYYYVDLIKYIKSKKGLIKIKNIKNMENIKDVIKFIPVKLEFKDHFCVYNIYTNKLLHEISYYNISAWKSGKYFWGINYKNFDDNELELNFRVEDSYNMCNSIKNKVNELLELNNSNKEIL